MKFNNRLLVMSLTAASTMAASAAVPAVAPSSYGQFTGKTTLPQVKKVQAFHSTDAKKNGPAKVQAYANDGNAMVDQIGTLTLLEEEDFSRLTTGSEEEPDLYTVLEINQWLTDPETGDIVCDDMGNIVENPDYNYPWDNMKPEYISGDGRWGVGNAYPAGGMLYFPFSEDAYQGKISTPWIDLSANNGTFVLEFKVKVTEEAKANPDLPPMIIVETAETNNMSPTWSYFEETFLDYEHLSTEWTTFRLLYQGAGPSTLCNIVGQGIAGGMFIDDVRLYSLTPYLATPVMVSGATRSDIFRRIIGEGQILLLLVTPIAIVIDWLLTVYEFTSWYDGYFEPVHFCVSVLVAWALMALMIAIGVFFPARRAMAISPAAAMKSE